MSRDTNHSAPTAEQGTGATAPEGGSVHSAEEVAPKAAAPVPATDLREVTFEVRPDWIRIYENATGFFYRCDRCRSESMTADRTQVEVWALTHANSGPLACIHTDREVTFEPCLSELAADPVHDAQIAQVQRAYADGAKAERERIVAALRKRNTTAGHVDDYDQGMRDECDYIADRLEQGKL